MRGDELDVVELAVVLHAHGVGEADALAGDPRLRELLRDPLLEAEPGAGDHRADPRPFRLAERRQQRHVDRLVVAVVEVGAGAAEGREARRPRGHEHLAVGDALGVAGDVQRAAAAVAEQRVVGGRVALAEDPPDRLVLERLLEQLDHPGRGRVDRQAERPRDLALDRGARALDVELDFAAEEVVGVETAEHEVRGR